MRDEARESEQNEHCEMCGSDTPLSYVFDEERRMLLVCDPCAGRVAGSGPAATDEEINNSFDTNR